MSVYKRGGCNKEGANGVCSKCGKRRGSCGIYWYKFMWQGKLVRESTKQGNDKVARQIEAAHRTSLAKGEVGIRERKRVTLSDFIRTRFEPWASGRFPAASQTWKSWYRPGLRALQNCMPLSKHEITEVTSEHIDAFAAHLRAKGLLPASVNARLRVVSAVLHKAKRWGVIEVVPDIVMLKGENHRDRVLTPDEESKYLAKASPLFRDVATILVDTAMRPEECFRMRWEHVTWVNGRHGSVSVTHGKTDAARRIIPLTFRVRSILQTRWEGAGRPRQGWVWLSATQSGHIEPSTLKKQHKRALRLSKVRPFVLYSLRHTMLTRPWGIRV